MPRVRQPATCPACDIEFVPYYCGRKPSEQAYCSLECRGRYKVRRGLQRCGLCGESRLGSPSRTYCKNCDAAVKAQAKVRFRPMCVTCGGPRDATAWHPSYCTDCSRERQRQSAARRPPRKTCAKCKRPRGDSPHKTYCRDCARKIGTANDRRRRAAGRDSKQESCSRCKQPRDGAHPAYCRMCWTGPIRDAKIARPCSICGQAKDRPDPDYCSRCRYGLTLKRYGMTLDDFDALLAGQDGRCAICGTTLAVSTTFFERTRDRACVDHDHATGRVRGLLCRPCNAGVGQFGDDPARLRAAAEYLER